MRKLFDEVSLEESLSQIELKSPKSFLNYSTGEAMLLKHIKSNEINRIQFRLSDDLERSPGY